MWPATAVWLSSTDSETSHRTASIPMVATATTSTSAAIAIVQSRIPGPASLLSVENRLLPRPAGASFGRPLRGRPGGASAQCSFPAGRLSVPLPTFERAAAEHPWTRRCDDTQEAFRAHRGGGAGPHRRPRRVRGADGPRRPARPAGAGGPARTPGTTGAAREPRTPGPAGTAGPAGAAGPAGTAGRGQPDRLQGAIRT